VARNIVHAFLENEKYLPSDIWRQFHFEHGFGNPAIELDIPRVQDITAESAHALYQVTHAILVRIDGPNDVAQRVH